MSLSSPRALPSTHPWLLKSMFDSHVLSATPNHTHAYVSFHLPVLERSERTAALYDGLRNCHDRLPVRVRDVLRLNRGATYSDAVRRCEAIVRTRVEAAQ